jgi:hypothetical protein
MAGIADKIGPKRGMISKEAALEQRFDSRHVTMFPSSISKMKMQNPGSNSFLRNTLFKGD